MSTSQEVLELKDISNLSIAESNDDAESNAAAVTAFRHIPALDGLRGIAVLTVMAYHLEKLVPALHETTKGGFLGVDIFFVLSGFLITSILLKEHGKTGRIKLKNFYLRRLFRLVPAYWLFLGALFLFGNFLLPVQEAAIIYSNNNFTVALLYLTNWSRAAGDGAVTGNLNHTWSLSIEEQFYIIWSLVLFFAFKENRSRKFIFSVTLAMIALVIVWRMGRALTGTTPDILYYSTDTRIDALLIGCAASMVYMWKLIPKAFFKSLYFDLAALSAYICAAVIFFNSSYHDVALYTAQLPLFTISTALIILWLMTREKTPVHFLLENKALGWIGKISYGLYLWHYVMYEFSQKTFSAVETQIVAGITLAFAVSAVSYYLVELPFLKIKDRFSS